MKPNLKRLYSLRDTKIAEFNPPCVFANDAAAMRSFGDMVKQDKTLVSLHPEDFALYFLGFFDVDSGSLVQSVNDDPESFPRSLATGSDFLVKE